jgi:small subunit ribosomal protein S5
MRMPNNNRPSDGFEERVMEVKRVSKKTTGGNAISFTALVVVGDKKGKVGGGYAKAKDVSSAVTKAIAQAKKSLITIPMNATTITHDVAAKYGAAKVFIKPAPKGSGIIAGGTIRTVLELAGVSDVSSKMLGSNNKICNIRCAIIALKKLRSI